MRPRVPLLPVVAIGFCCAGLVTAFAGLRSVVGSGSNAKLWLVLFVAAAIAALVFLRFARDGRGRVRLGVGWTVLGAVVVAMTITRTPSPGVGAPIGSGWAVLVAGGAGVVLGGIVLAVSPVARLSVHPAIVVAAVVAVVAVQVGGYAGAVGWTDGQNVRLTVADATPLRTHESTLDGRVRWIRPGSGYVTSSAGGVLTTSGNGMQMIDPATGTPRWSYHRADLTLIMDPVSSDDGTLVAAIGHPASLNPKPAQQAQQRLLVFNAVTGKVITDVLLGADLQGTLTSLGPDAAYFAGGPDGIQQLQITSVPLTGAKSGQRGWVYYPKDGCPISTISALGTELALSSSCGTVAMLDPGTGKPRWEYHALPGGAQLWPLTGTPAGTVLVATGPGPVNEAPGYGLASPKMIVSLDARTGAVRAQDTSLPPAPFTPDSQDAGVGTMGTIWAGGTAVLAYNLPDSRRIWLVGYRAGATPSTWTVVLPDVAYGQAYGPSGELSQYVAATPDGRIVLATQHLEDTSDLNAHPSVIVVDGKNGHVKPTVTVNGPQGLGKSTGFFAPPATLPTPGGVVLVVPGADQAGDQQTPPFLLVGLN